MLDYLDANPQILRRSAAHRALPLSDNWPTRRAFIPQGVDQQGRLTPTIEAKPLMPAEAATEIGSEDQSESADGEVGRWLVKGSVVVGLVLFCAWVMAGGADPFIAQMVARYE